MTAFGASAGTATPGTGQVVAVAESEPATQSKRRLRTHIPWLLAFSALMLTCVWARTLGGVYIVAGAVAVIAALTGGRMAALRRRGARAPEPVSFRRWWHLSFVCLALALAAGAVTERRLDVLGERWEEMLVAREARLTGELQRQMESVVDRGIRAAAAAAVSVDVEAPAAFDRLAEIRALTGVSALVVFDANGEPVAWDGEHRGPIPGVVHDDGTAIHYTERPLFSYLYFSSPVAESPGWRAVAAVLLQTEPVFQLQDQSSFAEQFEARTGARPHFTAGDSPGAAWRLAHDGVAVVYGRFDPVSQSEWRQAIALTGQRAAVGACLVALILLSVGWLRSARWRRRMAFVPLCAAGALFLVAPLGPVLGLERAFSPAMFMLPIPGELTLGTLLAASIPIAAWIATRRAPGPTVTRAWVALAIGAVAVALGFTGGLRLLLLSAAPPLLNEPTYLWGALFPAATLLLTIIAVLALPAAGARFGHAVRIAPLAAGIGASVALPVFLVLSWQAPKSAPIWLPALWVLPFGLMALGAAGYRGRGGQLARWLLSGWLAASAAVPHLWFTSMQARFEAAERELATLGTRADPYLDYLLRHFATDVGQRAARGESGVELLYRSWIASDMAREGYPATIAVWSPEGVLLQELSLGGGALLERQPTPPRWTLLQPSMDRARETGQTIVEVAENVPGVNQFMVAPLDDGRLISLVVPPRVSLDWATVLAPFLGASQRTDTELALVPHALDSDIVPDSVLWRPTEAGWRSEALVRLPDGEYHAHLELRVPSVGVQVARGVLLVSVAVSGLFLVWLVGRLARGEPPAPFGSWRRALRGFRARVTLALFAFFLIPTVVFGWIAYRAFAGEITRAARATAERAVAQAVAMYPEEEQSLAVVANRIGAEVLQFHRGELILASSPEAVALGLYDAWMPATAYAALRTGEQLAVVETRELVNHPYLLAYRRLAASGVLAVPVSLRSGEVAVRQTELMHLVLFAILVGGILSLALSVAVGRALTQPIGQLQRAAAAVGAGRLDVRLPERRSDEFGELYASFNRMIRRLRRARSQEIRSARVLAWGEMARQIAHEIKNPLTPIKLSVQHLKRAYRDRRPDFESVLESNVDHVLTEIDRLSDVARAFSRYGAPSSAAEPLEATRVDDVIREVVGLYLGGDSDILFTYDIADDLPLALARPGELKEVLFNIVENARDAIVAGGHIDVSAALTDEHVELAVADDGHGVDPSMMDRIFEPHFSTRSTGTGLGLAVVRRLVEGWGGRIEIRSSPRVGTTIRIRMRRADLA